MTNGDEGNLEAELVKLGREAGQPLERKVDSEIKINDFEHYCKLRDGGLEYQDISRVYSNVKKGWEGIYIARLNKQQGASLKPKPSKAQPSATQITPAKKSGKLKWLIGGLAAAGTILTVIYQVANFISRHEQTPIPQEISQPYIPPKQITSFTEIDARTTRNTIKNKERSIIFIPSSEENNPNYNPKPSKIQGNNIIIEVPDNVLNGLEASKPTPQPTQTYIPPTPKPTPKPAPTLTYTPPVSIQSSKPTQTYTSPPQPKQEESGSLLESFSNLNKKFVDGVFGGKDNTPSYDVNKKSEKLNKRDYNSNYDSNKRRVEYSIGDDYKPSDFVVKREMYFSGQLSNSQAKEFEKQYGKPEKPPKIFRKSGESISEYEARKKKHLEKYY
ncbi:MAG: hypothetical protein ABIH72_01755 [archaeon]